MKHPIYKYIYIYIYIGNTQILFHDLETLAWFPHSQGNIIFQDKMTIFQAKVYKI